LADNFYYQILDNEIPKSIGTGYLLGLTKAFRSKGYEGARLADLAEATGLKKAVYTIDFQKANKKWPKPFLLIVEIGFRSMYLALF